jgi:hypothetical protein
MNLVAVQVLIVWVRTPRDCWNVLKYDPVDCARVWNVMV